ncbi:MAG TPA: carbonic anhydrase [Beutenbergiaceae bacterium]|nr:carbonic anhydrase [Beutenbergiaceae bacterium]
MPSTLTPAQAFEALQEGNRRFVEDRMIHPSQDTAHRAKIGTEQHPFAVLFGCSDSRVAAEIIFDQGLGDLFVVRTAGHVLDTTVVGSIEFGIDVLGAPLVVVLGHDNCGAISGARQAMVSGEHPGGMVRAIIDRVIPSIVTRAPSHAMGSWGAPEDGEGFELVVPSAEELGREHVRETVHMLGTYSQSLAQRVTEGKAAIVGVEYTLADGRIQVVDSIGDVKLSS